MKQNIKIFLIINEYAAGLTLFPLVIALHYSYANGITFKNKS